MSITVELFKRRFLVCCENQEVKPVDFGESLFDPAGFRSLEVRIKEQLMAGAMADIQRKLFDYEDFNEIYLEDDDGFDPADPFSALEYIRSRQAAFNAKLAERQAQLEADFGEFMRTRQRLNDDATQEGTEIKATQATPVSQVGSGETSPAATE